MISTHACIHILYVYKCFMPVCENVLNVSILFYFRKSKNRNCILIYNAPRRIEMGYTDGRTLKMILICWFGIYQFSKHAIYFIAAIQIKSMEFTFSFSENKIHLFCDFFFGVCMIYIEAKFGFVYKKSFVGEANVRENINTWNRALKF